MLRFFRLNDPYRLLGVFVLLIGLSLPLFFGSLPPTLQELKDIVLGEMINSGKTMYLQVIDDTPWLASWFSGVFEFLFGRSVKWRHFTALVVICFQASFFAFILIRNRAYNESNYLPAFVFGVLCFFSFDMLSLSHELMAATFLLFALNNLFREIEFKVQRDETVLNLGIYLGLASLLVFSYSIFLIGVIIILFVFARISLRKSLLLLFGFVFPHSLLIGFYYLKGGLPELMRNFYLANLTLHTDNLISWKSIFFLGGVAILFFVISLIMLNREARFTKYQSQLLQAMLLWLVVAAVEVSITRQRSPHSFITFVPPLAYFISHYLLLIRRKWIAELMIWVFLFSFVGLSNLARLKKIKAIDYSGIFTAPSKYDFIKDKRILTLGDDDGLYQKNKAASYFLNWNLSSEVFNQPDYFENIILINESFEKDAPEIIIDESDLMKRIFPRMPKWQPLYQKRGSVYFLVQSNDKTTPR
ncbi:MAG: hypothetical protein JSS79_09940 [Bacteroidetes bacterium]|nr:hypothetical protein [Bacteroidota bacterium]